MAENMAATESALRAQIAVARVRPGSATDVGKMLTVLATLCFRQDKFDDAVAAGEDALRTLTEALPSDHRMVIASKTNLGLYLCPVGKLERAEGLLRDAIQTARRTLPNSPELGQALHNLALLYRNNNRWAEAEAAYEEAVAILLNVTGAAVTVTLRDQGIMWVSRGNAARARESFARAQAEVRARFAPSAASPIMQQLAADLASVDPQAAAAAASAARSDAGGLVHESRMTR